MMIVASRGAWFPRPLYFGRPGPSILGYTLSPPCMVHNVVHMCVHTMTHTYTHTCMVHNVVCVKWHTHTCAPHCALYMVVARCTMWCVSSGTHTHVCSYTCLFVHTHVCSYTCLFIHMGCLHSTFLHCVFPNVSSNRLPEKRHSHICHIYLTFLDGAF